MQNLTEKNLETIFWLEFIKTEFQLNNLRIDSLAFDVETNSFVIIEYKRWSSYSVVDQWMSYLALIALFDSRLKTRLDIETIKSFRTANDILNQAGL